MRPFRKQEGFSLLELILVLALIGLITGLTTPFLISSLDQVTGKSEVQKIAATLRYARSQAITQKTPFTFNADIDKNTYWLTELSTKEITQVFPLGPKIKLTQFSDENETIEDGEFFIVFFPQGNSSGGSIHLELTTSGDTEKTYAIAIDKVTGKPKLEHEEKPE